MLLLLLPLPLLLLMLLLMLLMLLLLLLILAVFCSLFSLRVSAPPRKGVTAAHQVKRCR